jgi:hypothetical protein
MRNFLRPAWLEEEMGGRTTKVISFVSPGSNGVTGAEVDTQLAGIPSTPRRNASLSRPRFTTLIGIVKVPPGAADNCTVLNITPTRPSDSNATILSIISTSYFMEDSFCLAAVIFNGIFPALISGVEGTRRMISIFISWSPGKLITGDGRDTQLAGTPCTDNSRISASGERLLATNGIFTSLPGTALYSFDSE